MSTVLMVMLGWLEARQRTKAMYKYAIAMLGAQCVTIVGTFGIPMLSVVSLDYSHMVFYEYGKM